MINLFLKKYIKRLIKTVNLLSMAIIFFFNYCIYAPSKRFACFENKSSDILFYSSSIAVVKRQYLDGEYYLFCLQKRPI